MVNCFAYTEGFRGLTLASMEAPKPASKEASRPASKEALKPGSKEAAKIFAPVASVPGAVPDLAAVLWPRATLHRRPETDHQSRRRAIDVGAVITRALTAAGLMK